MGLLFSLILAFCLVSACSEPFRNDEYEYKEEDTKTIDLSGQTKFTLENTNGIVHISGSDTSTNVHLEITRKVKSHSLEDAQHHIDDIVITDEARAHDIYVKVGHPNNGDRDYEVDFVITLPSHFNSEVYCGNGDIELSSITGYALLILGNGVIRLDEVTSDEVRGGVGNGSIEADMTPADSCSISFEVGNGNIALEIPAGTNAEVEASVGNGNITYSGLSFDNLQYSGAHLEGILGNGEGNILLVVGNGNIVLRGK
nr:MAG: hypothetical protein AM324_03440 [Candidatus Thorarchaeota archaeon SMTZ1-83]